MSKPAETSDPRHLFPALFAERSLEMQRLLRELDGTSRTLLMQGLTGSSFPLALSALLKKSSRPLLVLTASIERSEDLVGDLEFFGDKAYHFPKWEVLPYDDEELSLEVTAKTLDVFEALARHTDGGFAICAPVDALMLRTLPQDVLRGLTIRIAWGDRVDSAALEKKLVRAGYDRQPLVEARGEFSIRGGIIDIFPLNSENPIRIDLFGDEIESIREFDVSTQRSLSDLGTGADLIIPPSGLKRLMAGHLAAGERLQSLFDFLPKETILVLDAPTHFGEVCAHYLGAVQRQHEIVSARESGLPKPAELMLMPEELETRLASYRRLEHGDHAAGEGKGTTRIPFRTASYAGVTTELDAWIAQIRKFQSQDYLVAVVCDNDGQVQRFDELLREQEVSAVAVYESGWSEGFELRNVLSGFQDVLLLVGGLQTGFALPDARLCVLTDREIFGRYKRRHVYRKIYKGKPIVSSNEIRRGDYVVHVDHGIGKFLGMRVQEIDGRMVELIEILYADDDKLLVPIEKIHRVQKYAGPEANEPALDKLGSSKWAKRRQKHSEEIDKMAEELLQLYAARQLATREPHPPDTRLMREFESSFLYQETPDQMKAIVESKQDMERPRPMDRLVCGDVGYGKTEVAIRTIFKCTQSGRQAAVLCPTTILAQQHYNNFRERFADYPVRIDMISRFKKPQEIREIKKKLKAGELDIVVGTHALLSKDVEFKNLGLVCVDEEQRFGVKAKERLKEMRTEIDLLTLSATPIPRTLHMALSGLRDLSLITTPPPDRQPIKTKIISFETEQIAEAILRELNRGGQVYFIHNRVASIQEVVRRLQEVVPHARITFAHGQMKEDELEETMLKFIDHQFDILVSTTIVESGVDIPNCNTIIINRADAFGLAQLYQLRGRVGREKRRAYAYLIVPQGRPITESAVKRLQAIEEFAELGVGFSIAMRDLEIRGAGDLLGKAQHGTISEIGFELFCELLEEKVRERSGGESRLSQQDIEIKWDASCFLPPQYVPIESQRVTFYKRLAQVRDAADLEAVREELRDRYGEPPESARTLLASYDLRLACLPLGIAGIRKSSFKIRITLIQPVAHKLEPVLKKAVAGIPEVRMVAADAMDQLLLTVGEKVDNETALATLKTVLARAAELGGKAGETKT
ncbi:transcription-repair coupling factor [bacterium]|nr:transcription-repair coupling factor [bacterium]